MDRRFSTGPDLSMGRGDSESAPSPPGIDRGDDARNVRPAVPRMPSERSCHRTTNPVCWCCWEVWFDCSVTHVFDRADRPFPLKYCFYLFKGVDDEHLR